MIFTTFIISSVVLSVKGIISRHIHSSIATHVLHRWSVWDSRKLLCVYKKLTIRNIPEPYQREITKFVSVIEHCPSSEVHLNEKFQISIV
jgi:hypothetical protein